MWYCELGCNPGQFVHCHRRSIHPNLNISVICLDVREHSAIMSTWYHVCIAVAPGGLSTTTIALFINLSLRYLIGRDSEGIGH